MATQRLLPVRLLMPAFLVALIALAIAPGRVSAEPLLEVHPPRTHCAVPLMVEGSGLPPNKAVSLELTFEGSRTGDVGGVSTGDDGHFSLPVPFALFEGCARDGNATAALLLDGEQTGVSVDFEVVGPLAPPSPPASGDTPAAGPGNRRAIGAGVALIMLSAGLGLPCLGRRRTRPTSG
ncbi:MAG: hypothetical protein AB7N24_06380 [Dehalococcoidia bacterium]